MQLEPTNECNPKEIALKSFFLGPQAENAEWFKELFSELLDQWVEWRRAVHPEDGRAISFENQTSRDFLARKKIIQDAAHELLTRFEQEVPKFSPRYVGHMFSEISLPALLGHVITLFHNPNNISGESSQVGVIIEDEAVGYLIKMIGYDPEQAIGHFTSGGTVANLEALIRAHSRFSLWLSAGACLKSNGLKADHFDLFKSAHCGWESYQSKIDILRDNGKLDDLNNWSVSSSNPYRISLSFAKITAVPFFGPIILVPQNKHYSWIKGGHLIGLGSEALWPIELDEQGKSSVKHLEILIAKAKREQRPILLVVSVAGTTELGGIDPIDEIQKVLDRERTENGNHIWHHIDAAFGGFFRSIDFNNKSDPNARALAAVSEATSITLDPHKLGYVPYSSGTFLAREKRDYYFSLFEDAPYVDFNNLVDRGPYTLEGSRSAAGAVATWMSAKTMGLDSEGYGLLLGRTLRIKNDLEKRLLSEIGPQFIQIAPGCDTNILCFHCARPGETLSKSNERTLALADYFSVKNKHEFTVSKTRLRFKQYAKYLKQWTPTWHAQIDSDEVVLIRMCLMNPFFGSVETKANFEKEFVQIVLKQLKGDR